jgi:hypothetical protein
MQIWSRDSIKFFIAVKADWDQFTWHIDSDTPTWREDIRAKVIEEVTNEDGGLSRQQRSQKICVRSCTDDDNEMNEDDEFDCQTGLLTNQSLIKSSSEALKLAQFRGLEELSNAIFM